MIDIIRGASDKPGSTDRLIEFVESSGIREGVLYTGYPIVASMEGKSSLDALLISSEHGVIVFDMVEEPEVSKREEIRDELYNIVLQRLIGNKDLSEKRGQLKSNLNVLTIAPSRPKAKKDKETLTEREDFQSFPAENKQGDLTMEDYKKVIQAITKLKARPPRLLIKNRREPCLMTRKNLFPT